LTLAITEAHPFVRQPACSLTRPQQAALGEAAMFYRNLCLSALVCFTLVACVSFTVSDPQPGTVFTLPSPVKVNAVAVPDVRGGVDVTDLRTATSLTNQVSIQANQLTAAISLPAGQHKLSIAADVSCWYCSGGVYRPVETRAFCVAPMGTGSGPFLEAMAKADSKAWAATATPPNTTTPTGVSLVQFDPPGLPSLWRFRPAQATISNDRGIIESAQFPCYCITSVSERAGTPVGLAACDDTDPVQTWQALQVSVVSGHGMYRFQNAGRGVSDACLTEGSNGLLIQQNCNDLDSQLWATIDRSSNTYMTPFP
jgi:hypothetical protein